jgi:hypothetical protein
VPLRKTKDFVLSHPGAAIVTKFMLHNFERLSALDIDELTAGVVAVVNKEWKDSLQANAKEGMDELINKGVEMLNVLSHLELPREIIPLETIVEFLIDFAIKRLGKKYKVAVGILRAALEAADQWHNLVLEPIADALKSGGIDPNELYRELIRDKLNPELVKIRDEFVAALVAKIKEVPFLKDHVGRKIEGLDQPVEADLSGEDFPEVAEFPREGAAPIDAAVPPAPSPSSGAPLAPGLRASAEASLGHDFSHVRLHEGADAAAATRAFHAEGLTTGSHVYLRPGLSIDSGFGSRVFHHELAHVVQQTGPRPLDVAHSDTPSLGAPGRGVTWNPSAEAAADRAASQATTGGAGAPVAAGRATGLQPFGGDFFRRFLSEVTSEKSLKEHMIAVDERAPSRTSCAPSCTRTRRRRRSPRR